MEGRALIPAERGADGEVHQCAYILRAVCGQGLLGEGTTGAATSTAKAPSGSATVAPAATAPKRAPPPPPPPPPPQTPRSSGGPPKPMMPPPPPPPPPPLKQPSKCSQAPKSPEPALQLQGRLLQGSKEHDAALEQSHSAHVSAGSIHAGAQADPDRDVVSHSGSSESKATSGVGEATVPEHCSSLIALLKVGICRHPASGTSYNRCDDLLQSEQLSSKEPCQSAGHEVLCRFPPSLIFSPVANRWMELAAAQISSCATTSYLSSMQRSPPQRPSPISPCANASPLLSWTKVRHSHRVGCISTAKHQCNSLDIIIAATCSSVAHDGLNILCMPLLAESPMLS